MAQLVTVLPCGNPSVSQDSSVDPTARWDGRISGSSPDLRKKQLKWVTLGAGRREGGGEAGEEREKEEREREGRKRERRKEGRGRRVGRAGGGRA